MACCGLCKYNEYSVEYDWFVCDNEDSDCYGLETTYEDCCEEFEEKE